MTVVLGTQGRAAPDSILDGAFMVRDISGREVASVGGVPNVEEHVVAVLQPGKKEFLQGALRVSVPGVREENFLVRARGLVAECWVQKGGRVGNWWPVGKALGYQAANGQHVLVEVWRQALGEVLPVTPAPVERGERLLALTGRLDEFLRSEVSVGGQFSLSEVIGRRLSYWENQRLQEHAGKYVQRGMLVTELRRKRRIYQVRMVFDEEIVCIVRPKRKHAV